MLKVTLQNGGNPCLADLERIKSKLSNMSELTQKLGQKQHEMTLEDYGSQRTPDGAGWVGGEFFNGLKQSGAMEGGIQLTAGGNTATITATDFKSIFHQEGTSRTGWENSKGIPARPFIGIGGRHESELKQTAEQYLIQLLS